MKTLSAVIGVLALVSVGVAHGQIRRSAHILTIMEENRSYEKIVGQADAPYFNYLITKGALATQFYATTHGSFLARDIQYAGVKIADRIPTCVSAFTNDNLVRRMNLKGQFWKSYNEDLPYVGDQVVFVNQYDKGHNGLTYWSDACGSLVTRSQTWANFLWDFTSTHWQPTFADINPSNNHNMHNASDGYVNAVRRGDAWLAQYVPIILAMPAFQPGGDGQLWITFDEGDLYTDSRHGGGRVVTLFLGPQAKPNYKSTRFHKTEDLLRTWCLSLGCVAPFPGASNVPGSSLYELFQ